jgi:hypothetical protein
MKILDFGAKMKNIKANKESLIDDLIEYHNKELRRNKLIYENNKAIYRTHIITALICAFILLSVALYIIIFKNNYIKGVYIEIILTFIFSFIGSRYLTKKEIILIKENQAYQENNNSFSINKIIKLIKKKYILNFLDSYKSSHKDKLNKITEYIEDKIKDKSSDKTNIFRGTIYFGLFAPIWTAFVFKIFSLAGDNFDLLLYIFLHLSLSITFTIVVVISLGKMFINDLLKSDIRKLKELKNILKEIQFDME